MSHYVKVQIALNVKQEINIVENILKEIKNMDNFYFKNFTGIKKIINTLKNAKLSLENIANKEIEERSQELINYQIKIDTIMKQVGNMKSLLNYTDVLINYVKEKNNEINQIILEQGFQAIVAIENLSKEKIKINKENLLLEIENIRNKNMEISKIKNIKKSLEKMLPQLQIPFQSQKELFRLIETIKTPQLATDVSALINNMVIGKNRNEKISNEIKNVLNDIGFFTKPKYEYKITENNTLITILSAYNDYDKNIKIYINTDGGLEYQMGNYEGHLCEADSEKFRELLQKKITFSEPKIIRNTTNNKPRTQAAKTMS